MKSEYEIFLENRAVGKAQLGREGLYYRVKCLCRLPDRSIHRIFVKCSGETIDLGICVPVCGGFGLETRVPAKNLYSQDCKFLAVGKGTHEKVSLIVLTEGKPFAYLERLHEATFRISNSQPCMQFKSKND